MGKPPVWKKCTLSDYLRVLCLTVEKKIPVSKIMPQTIKIQHAINCIRFSNIVKLPSLQTL